MKETDFLKDQFVLAHSWTLKLIIELDNESWFKTPEQINTNINWLVGHIFSALYFQALVCTGGNRDKIKEALPLKEWIELYKMGSSPADRQSDKPNKEALLRAIQLVYESVLQHLDTMAEEVLNEPVEVKHPVAKTKREVLMWCTHHQMWHNGQISFLKRVITGKSW